MNIPLSKLKELLVPPGHVGAADFAKAAEEAEKSRRLLEEVLVEDGYVSEEHLGKAIADGYDLRHVDLKTMQIPEDCIDLLPEVVARAQRAVVFGWTADTVKLATSNIDFFELKENLERKTQRSVEVYYATPRSIEEGLKQYRGDMGKRIARILAEMEEDPSNAARNERHTVDLVNAFLEHAYTNRASDIHLEPLHETVSVRFRIDGALHEVTQYSRVLHDAIVLRLKIMARLRTDEHAASQDGRFEYAADDMDIAFDVRISVLPVMYGENIVLRLLAERARRIPLEELGLRADELGRIRSALERPHGMILATGPTGSGKTTTLYAMLQILNEPEVNIMTIEDPVEYSIPHVQQTQVNSAKDLTFATGLRAIVRQDPDIIMVGEIRDEDTASIAINAALTGHLLLSTLHTNDAATAFPRLTDMGIEPFLLASSVNIVIAQRLVRKICQSCRVSYPITREEIATLSQDTVIAQEVEKAWRRKTLEKAVLYKGKGCDTCQHAGFSGRTGIFEIMEISDGLRPLITEKAASGAIDGQARKEGMTSLAYDGLIKVAEGITTLNEVLRATRT